MVRSCRTPVVAGCALAGAAMLWSATAQAQCQFDREITFAGEIGFVAPTGQIMTLSRPFENCVIVFLRSASALPTTCQAGRAFTATGRVVRNPGNPASDNRGGDFMATTLSCR